MSISYNPTQHSVIKRIKVLERQNLVMKVIVMCLAVLVVACQPKTTTAQAPMADSLSLPDVLEVQKIVLKDDNQDVRLVIDATDSNDIFQAFYDHSGVERARIGIDELDSARFRLFDSKSTLRFNAVTFSDNHPQAANRVSMAILGADNQDPDNVVEKGGIVLTTSPSGAVGEYLFDKDGGLRIENQVFDNGMVGKNIYDNNAVLRLSEGVLANGNTTRQMLDNTGKSRHSLTISEGESSLVNEIIFDKQGVARLVNFTNGNTSGQIHNDQAGETKTSTAIDADNTVAHFVEPTAREKLINATDTVIRTVDIIRLLTGGGE